MKIWWLNLYILEIQDPKKFLNQITVGEKY